MYRPHALLQTPNFGVGDAGNQREASPDSMAVSASGKTGYAGWTTARRIEQVGVTGQTQEPLRLMGVGLVVIWLYTQAGHIVLERWRQNAC